MTKLKFILLTLLTLFALNSCRLNTTKDLINSYVNDIVDFTTYKNYTYTYKKVNGDFYIEEAEDVYIINIYTYYNVKTFICWRVGDELYWNELRYATY